MGILDQLDISNRVIDAAKRRTKTETIEYRRQKLIANIEEQIELAGLALRGKELVLQRKRGTKVVTVRPRIWWSEEADGDVYVHIRYNKIALNIAGRGTTIHVGKLSGLPDVLQMVIAAVQAGELDASIENVAKKSAPTRL
jgi:hypothetical protein